MENTKYTEEFKQSIVSLYESGHLVHSIQLTIKSLHR